MKSKKTRGILLLLFLSVNFSYSMMNINFPGGTKSLLYVRDIKNLESNLQKSGFLKLPPDYRSYIIEYLKEENPSLQAYQEFRNLDAGNFIKSVIGETALLTVRGENIFIIKLDRKSQYFVTLLNIFKVKGQFSSLYVEFINDTVVLSRNASLIDLYRKSSSKIDDAVLKNQNLNDSDVIYYTKGNVVLHPFLDSLFVKESGEKSFSVAINFQKKDIVLCTRPSLFEYNGIRLLNPGQMVPSTALIYLDTLRNPQEFFLKVFGDENMREYKNDFKNLFENQTTIAITSLSPEIKPSFLVVVKPKVNKMDEAEKLLFKFFKQVIGEKEWNKKPKGAFTVNVARNSPYCFLSSGGYIAISDDEASLDNSIKVLSKKLLSIWDEKDNQEIKALLSKPFAFYINFSSLANNIYKSMLKKMDLDSSQKDDIKTYMKAMKEMGSLSGYGEIRKDYNYFYFTLKEKSKEK